MADSSVTVSAEDFLSNTTEVSSEGEAAGDPVPMFICLVIDATWGSSAAEPDPQPDPQEEESESPAAWIVAWSEEEMLEEAKDIEHAVIPLYQVLESTVLVDFRLMPIIPMAEAALV